MPMEVIFKDDDLEPVPETAKSKPEKPLKPGASSAAPAKAAVRISEHPREESLFGDLEDALGLEPVFAPAPGPFGAPPAKLPDWIKASAEAPPALPESLPAFEPDDLSDEAQVPRAGKPARRKKAERKSIRSAAEAPEAGSAGPHIITSPEDVAAFDVLREDGTVVEVDRDTCTDPEVFEAERRRRSGGRKPKPVRNILTRAMDALSRREYSRRELGRKLLQGLLEGETREEISAALDKLESMGLLSDERYAEAKIRSCAGRMGDMRLKRELRMSGVSGEAIEEAMASLEEPEEVRALRIWGRRWSELPKDWKEREKMVRYLATRGFSMSAIQKVLRGEVELPEDQM